MNEINPKKSLEECRTLGKTIIENETREAGTVSKTGHSENEERDIWDGTNDRGIRVRIGTYYFKIATNRGEKAFGKIIYLR